MGGRAAQGDAVEIHDPGRIQGADFDDLANSTGIL